MDKQYAIAVILIVFGLALTQMQGEETVFLMGLGVGTVAIAVIWVIRILIRDIKRR